MVETDLGEMLRKFKKGFVWENSHIFKGLIEDDPLKINASIIAYIHQKFQKCFHFS